MKLKAIKEIDVFGPKIELRLGKKKSHKTFCGATMTVFVFLCCITACIIIGKELIQKDNPNVTFRQILADEVNNPNKAEIKQYGAFDKIELNDIELMIGIKDYQGDDILEQYRNLIQIQFNYVEKNGERFQRTSLNIEECQENQLDKYELGYVDHKAYFCLSKSDSFSIWGNSSEEKGSYFEVSVYCNPSDCKELYQNYKQLKLHVLFKDQYFTPDKYLQPFTPLYTNRFIEFSLTETNIDGKQDLDMVLQKATVVTDEGWIQAELDRSNYLILKEISRSFYSYDQNTLNLNVSITSLRVVYEVQKLNYSS